ncbi:MAG: hypothetical protein R2750_08145 [Bacteroidales bacterium]
MEKIKKVVKLENLPPEAFKALYKKYPDGWKDHVKKITKPNGEYFYAISIDTSDASYMAKVSVKVDSKSDVEKLNFDFVDKMAEREAAKHSKGEADDGDDSNDMEFPDDDEEDSVDDDED